MCFSLRLLLAELLGSWLYLTLGGLGTTHSYSDSWGLPLSWGVSLSVGSLVGGPNAHLNPAVTIAWATVGGTKWSSVPGRLVGQLGGAMLAAISLVYALPENVITNISMSGTGTHLAPGSRFPLHGHGNSTEEFDLPSMMETNSSQFEWVEPWISVPEEGVAIFPTGVVKFALAAGLFQLMVCSSHGSPVNLGVSLAAVVHAFGAKVGAGINPAREATGRLVLAWLGWSWEVVFHDNVWVWIPLLVGVAGAVAGAFLHLAMIEVPRRKEEERNIKKKRKWSKIAKMSGMDLDYNYIFNLENLSEKEKAVLTTPPPPPPPPPQTQTTPNLSPKTVELDTKKMTLEEELKEYYRQNNLSTPEIQKHLARYRAVSVDNLESRGVGGDTGSVSSGGSFREGSVTEGKSGSFREGSVTEGKGSFREGSVTERKSGSFREGSVTGGKLELGGGVTVSVKHTCEEEPAPAYSKV